MPVEVFILPPQVFSYDDAGNLSVDLNKLIELLPVEQEEGENW